MNTFLFYISKILRPVLTSPLFIVIVLCYIAFFALKAHTRFQRVTKALGLIALVLLTAFSEPFIANWLATLWEYPRSDIESCLKHGPYDAIVVLGGSLDPVSSKPGDIEGNDSFERLVAAAELFKRGAAPIVIASGGSGSITYSDIREAPYMSQLLQLMGVSKGSIVEEGQSKNTFENAVYSKKILVSLDRSANKKPHIILVTSAWHMRRSAAIFRKASIDFSPCSVDSIAEPPQSPSDFFPDAWALTRTTRILREMIGYVSYWVMGRL